MRFVGLRLASEIAVAFTMLIGIGAAAGCKRDEHVGRPCDLGAAATNPGGGATDFVLAQPAAECPSSVCVGVAGGPQSTEPLCTANCGSNDDCADGELADPNDPTDTRCKTGFVCMWPTIVGPLNCQRFCVCRDLVSPPQGGFTKPAPCP